MRRHQRADHMSNALLSVAELRVTYGGSIVGVQHVDLDVRAGESVALLGANGAGKSTVLRSLGGLLPFHRGKVARGSITFDGRSILRDTPDRIVAAGIGQSLEGRRIFTDLTVAENLTLGAFNPRARKHADASLKEACELFPRLGERLTQPAGTLSGGEQQMLAIARGIAAKPKLLLLDEPSLGLAPIIVAEIGTAIRAIADEGTAVLLVDQSTTLALRSTDRAYLLENGKTVAHDTTPALLANEKVRESYLGMTASTASVDLKVEQA